MIYCKRLAAWTRAGAAIASTIATALESSMTSAFQLSISHRRVRRFTVTFVFCSAVLFGQANAVEPASKTELRVISLAPHLTELMFTAGAEQYLVGVVEWSDYPAAAGELPRIGDAFRFDIERIISLQTTHALAWAGGTPMAAIDQLESLGIEVLEIETRTLNEIAQALREIGDRFDSQAQAQAAAAEFEQQLQALDKKHGGSLLPVFYQVSERPLFTLGGRHVINEVFALCGARNIFAELEIEASVVGREAVIAAAPWAMIAGDSELNPSDAKADQPLETGWPEQAPLGHWRTFNQIPAVACGHAWTVDPALLVRPTPRILEGATQLCAWLDQLKRQAADPACSIAHD